MVNKRILWIFPLLTQLIFSLFLPFFGGLSGSGLGYVFLFAALPAFLFGLVCLRYQFHQRNLVQLGFWAGAISFLTTLVLFSVLLMLEQPQGDISVWEHTFAVIAYAIMFALPSAVYAMVVLRLFLAKKII